MALPRLRTDAHRVQPLTLTNEHPSQKRARSATKTAPESLARHQRVAPGGEGGADIGFERRPALERQVATRGMTTRGGWR